MKKQVNEITTTTTKCVRNRGREREKFLHILEKIGFMLEQQEDVTVGGIFL